MSTDEVFLKVNQINEFIQKSLWFDFEIIRYEQNNLYVGGGESLSYPYELEIHFEDVCLVSTPVEWCSDTSTEVLQILEGEEAYKVNIKFKVERGYFVFKFIPEDFPNDGGCFIGAKDLNVKFLKQKI
ncbi:hypothetical protein [Saccharibacillus brassicae]|uniref:Uncharacterized protein n=1 Tax=Saccharibacillus brassicae TaxID=2583377 RepID=A0A4Y6UYE4_SACBS|nr:hypothetical protein [Saccharibacillus brassicae]QDH21610.1 hypothetical protein FFV09_12610 [Saccharibacillus brassicae]